MPEVYLVGGLRTIIGKKNGSLKNILPERLAAIVLNGILKKYALQPQNIDEVIAGNIIGPGGNISRVCVLEAGWPYSIPAFSIDAQCASGLTAIDMASALIASGRAQLIVAGGTESSSLAPSKRLNAKDPRYQGPDLFYKQAPFVPMRLGDPNIGLVAERLAVDYHISRRQMDEFALRSHQKACLAQKKDLLKDIIIPIESNYRDDGPKSNMNMALLSRLKGAYQEGGNITAGNSCRQHDGAAFLLLASKEALKKYNLLPQAILSPTVNDGCDPHTFPLGPIPAIEKLLSIHQQYSLHTIDAVEINEAFAVQILICCQELGLSFDKVNQLGGAIAFGHPYGASGAIILLHMLQTLNIKRAKTGIAAIGAVGGLATAMLMQRI